MSDPSGIVFTGYPAESKTQERYNNDRIRT